MLDINFSNSKGRPARSGLCDPSPLLSPTLSEFLADGCGKKISCQPTKQAAHLVQQRHPFPSTTPFDIITHNKMTVKENPTFDAFIGCEIPVKISNSVVGDSSQSQHKPLPVFDFDGLDNDHQGKPRYELMEIHISLYTLSGISYQPKKSNEKRRKRLEKTAWRRKTKGTMPIPNDGQKSTGASTSRGGATLSTISESCGMPAIGFEMNSDLAPTTAVVSTTRNDPSSNRPMETFSPSLPLLRLGRGDPYKIRYHARWSYDQDSRMTGTGDESSPSFKILRMMNQQQFVPATNIGEVSTYEHEQVDLCVFVGRGREMIPIGVVSFVVTGDEESETILNLPVKKPAVGSVLYERHFQTKRKKNVKESFASDPDHIFSLESNATLRIGVRAFPQRNFIEAQVRSAEAQAKEEKIFGSVLQKIIDAELLDNIEEERSLIEDLVDAQFRRKYEEEQLALHPVVSAQETHGSSSLHEQPQELLDSMTMMDPDLICRKFQGVLHQEMQPQVRTLQEQAPLENPPDPQRVASTPLAMMSTNLFCSFPFFSSNLVPENTKDPTIPQQVVTVNREKTGVNDPNNIPRNLTLVSSVSDSVTTEGGHSNAKFQSELAEF